MAVWYFSRREIEENSPSRRDGVTLKKETLLRKSYSTFLQELGKTLLVPQVAIATAITFRHRFFVRQSHAKNDAKTIAIACMFLAAKVEETPRALRDLIVVSYEMIHEKDQVARQRIRQKEVYEQQKELVLRAEKIVLSTLDFDFEVRHPYATLMDAVKRFKVLQETDLAKVAWNFVNDSLKTSLCLQYKPHQIAATAIFLAARLLKLKLPSDWWGEFDVTLRQLDETSKQLLDLYERRPVPTPSPKSEVGSSCTEMVAPRPTSTNARCKVEHAVSRRTSSHPPHVRSSLDDHGGSSGANQCGTGSVITDHKNNVGEVPGTAKEGSGRTAEEESRNIISQSAEDLESLREKVKAKLGKAKKLQGDHRARKKNPMDEDDLIERELENVQLLVEDDKTEQTKGENTKKIEKGDQAVRMQTENGQEIRSTEEGEIVEH